MASISYAGPYGGAKSPNLQFTKDTSENVNNFPTHTLSEGDIPSSQQSQEGGDISSLQSQEVCEQNSLQVLTAKEFLQKIQALRYVLESDPLACDAKWTLFVATALSHRYECKLIPFPPRFAHEQTGYNIDALVSVINETPKLKVVLQNIVERNFEDMDTEVIDLLHWVLIIQREPYLRLVDGEEVCALLQTVDEKDIPRTPTHVFEVSASEGFHSDAAFRKRIADLPLKAAFLGQTLDSYYSIIHNGFKVGEKEEPVILSTDLLTSLRKSPSGAAWGASQCGSLIACTALCEFAYDTAVDKITPNCRGKSCIDIELNDATKMRIRYLLFYGSRFPQERKLRKCGLKAWISHHKYGLSLASYLLLLASIGVANSGSGNIIKLFVSNKILDTLEFCRKILGTE